jgi:hypothetical protein
MITLPHNSLQSGGRVPLSLYEIIKGMNLDTGLAFCVDAGDVRSLPSSSSQRWNDLSGNGVNFYNGTNDTVGAADHDAVFQGTINARSANEYWLGATVGSHFLPVSAPAFDNNLHKAAAKFSMLAIVGGSSTNWYLGGNGCVTGLAGITIEITAARKVKLTHTTTDGLSSQVISSTGVVPAGNPAVMTAMLSYDDTGLSAIMKADNAAFDTLAFTASTATVATTAEFALGCDGSQAGAPIGVDFSSPARFYAAAVWTGVALSGANMDLLRAALKDNRWTGLT